MTWRSVAIPLEFRRRSFEVFFNHPSPSRRESESGVLLGVLDGCQDPKARLQEALLYVHGAHSY